MARNNYSYERRQRELAKKKKKEEKRLKKLEKAKEDKVLEQPENVPGESDIN